MSRSQSDASSADPAEAGATDPAESPKATLDRIVETAIYLQSESRRLAREQCARHGITATQLNVLKLLETVGDLSLSELSRRMAAKNSTITGIVDRMCAADLLVREQSADDRRVWKIRLTDAGRALAQRITVGPWQLLRSAITALPPAELEALFRTLSKVAAHVEAAAMATEKGNP